MPLKSTKLIALKALALVALFAGISVAGVKRVFVADVGISASASAKLTQEEIPLVTKSLRREAVKNLPPGEYEIMTSETVIAQGSAVLEKCDSDECVISLGSAIGADYIVRGTVSKIRTMFALSVEIHETENGNLVASSELVSSENIVELIEKGAMACADMYKIFANARNSTQKAPTTYTITAAANPNNGGYVSRNPEQTHYAPGTIVSVTATPASGYEFTGWSGASTSTNATLTGPMKRDLTLTANFSKNSEPDVESKTEPVGWVSEPEPEDTSYSAMYGTFDNRVAWKPESKSKIVPKNAFLISTMPLLFSAASLVKRNPAFIFFELQYERTLYNKMSIVGRYEYFENTHGEIAQSSEVLARYYIFSKNFFSKNFFLDGMFGNYSWNDHAEFNEYSDNYFKFGASLGAQFTSGKERGFAFEISAGWKFAINRERKENEYKYDSFMMGGAGPGGVCALGWRF